MILIWTEDENKKCMASFNQLDRLEWRKLFLGRLLKIWLRNTLFKVTRKEKKSKPMVLQWICYISLLYCLIFNSLLKFFSCRKKPNHPPPQKNPKPNLPPTLPETPTKPKKQSWLFPKVWWLLCFFFWMLSHGFTIVFSWKWRKFDSAKELME